MSKDYRVVPASGHVYEVLDHSGETIGEVWRIDRFLWGAKRRSPLLMHEPLPGSPRTRRAAVKALTDDYEKLLWSAT